MKTAEAYEHEQGWDFEKAAMPYVDSLYNTAYRMTRNSEDAEDLVQETYLRAWRATLDSRLEGVITGRR